MGALTGSFEMWMVTRPLPLNPAKLIVARSRFLMDSQIAAVGRQVCAEACSGVSRGGWFVGATQSGSTSPICIFGPAEVTRSEAEPSANETSMRQRVTPADAQGHKNVGAVISGGKIEPSSG